MNTEDTLILSPQPLTQAQVVESTNPDVQTRRRKIHCKQELIVMSLQTFYSNRKDLPEILELLQGTSAISLRLIDWFVTNYAKRHSIGYLLGGQEFMVYMNYKSQLKAYSKKLFDPFCRRERIMFSLPGIPAFVTTVGKLNFFRWAIENNIIEYTVSNMEIIEKDMNSSLKYEKEESDTKDKVSDTQTHTQAQSKKETRRRKRHELSVSAAKSVSRHNVNIVVEFS
ncbi:MAG: hypothetical protein EB127_23070 [Alphaproteobacteria bacterium]|nr:hypothetical protein [Alphaproteobacteria bacterium]